MESCIITKAVKDEHVDSLRTPNNLVHKDRGSTLSGRWPAASLLINNEQKSAAFIDPMHKVTERYEWENYPPTWLDPEAFCALALKNEEVKKLCQKCVDKQNKEPLKQLEPVLVELLKTEYLKYMLYRFEKAKSVTAEYVAARYATRLYDKLDA